MITPIYFFEIEIRTPSFLLLLLWNFLERDVPKYSGPVDFLGIILVGESSAIGEKDLAYKLSRGSRINLYVAIISFLYLKVKKTPHLIRSAEKKLLLIKNIVLYD